MSLEIDDITQGYDGRTILDGVSLRIEPGSLTTVLGPNGSGKSTLIRTVCNLMRPWSGTVSIDGRDISDIDRKELSKIVGYVPQKYIPSDYMQVFEAVLIGRAPHMNWSYSKADFKAASDAIITMGLEDLMEKDINDLSGGQIQKVIVARALAQDPTYYILDEPTSALDLKNQMNTLRVMRNIMGPRGAGVLVALHDLNLAMRFSDNVIMLKDGKVFAEGRPEDVINEDNIRDVYGVSSEVVEGRKGLYVHICEDDDPDDAVI